MLDAWPSARTLSCDFDMKRVGEEVRKDLASSPIVNLINISQSLSFRDYVRSVVHVAVFVHSLNAVFCE